MNNKNKKVVRPVETTTYFWRKNKQIILRSYALFAKINIFPSFFWYFLFDLDRVLVYRVSKYLRNLRYFYSRKNRDRKKAKLYLKFSDIFTVFSNAENISGSPQYAGVSSKNGQCKR